MSKPTRIAALFGVCVLTACAGTSSPSVVPTSSPSPSTSPSDSLPNGWELVQVDDPGFALAMPQGWIKISGEDVTDTGIFEQLAEDNPEAAAAMEQARAAIESGQMSFLGVETG